MGVDGVRRDRALLERDGELGAITAHLAAAQAGEGSVNVIEGQAGLGKTELLRAAGELGEAAGMRVLRAKGSALDRDFAFGMVRQLLERVVLEEPDLLTGGAEPAAAVFAAAGDERDGTDGLYASLQALYWLLANLAARGPVLLLADDLHWADAASLRWLVFLAERVEEVPAVLLAASRPAEPGAEQDLLDALMTGPVAMVARPEPLSASATTAVVNARLPEAVGPFSAACHRATGGNPFLLGELLSELVADGVTGDEDEASHVLEFGSERVGLAVRRRLRLLPGDATAVARAVAVLGSDVPLDEAAAIAGIDIAAAARAADALAGIDILTADPALDFVHPVVHSAVYEQIAPLERQALHAEAAQLLSARGAENERVARHLLRLPPAADS